jgi:uncharacterized protein DUF1298
MAASKRHNARMEGIALTDEDRTILALESAAVAGHTCKVVLIEAGAPSSEGLAASIAVLAAVAGALRTWIERHHGRLGGVRVKVPVSLHHAGDGEGNRDSFFTLELPLGEPDPVARLAAVRAATAARKADHDAETLDVLMRDLAGASPHLEHFCRRLEASPRTFALNVSNVPGPPASVTVLGAPVEAVYSLAEIGQRHALRIAVVSLAGRLHFGLCADPAIVDDVGLLAEGVEAEVEALVEAR